MVHTPSRQSQGFAVPLSILLEKVVKADLGESVKLHPLKVLNHKSVLTYMKKNQVVPQAGESSKQSAETASENKFTADSLQSLTNKPKKEAVEKKKLVKEKAVVKKKQKTVTVVKMAVAGSQAAPAKSKSGTNSDEDTHPLSKLGVGKKGGAARNANWC
ncbi:hypothetical protein F511_12622 [Dorcoceras hygrometricum]|uniref:Uncharacterized protein n=1 Tax=Dorcoceras hygrometricum TaxID=472368 RepID=A0A2Z7BKF2_9LAMI|nr:hypothetical protein F511_12622 [Dorcoceras hygrometricum]